MAEAVKAVGNGTILILEDRETKLLGILLAVWEQCPKMKAHNLKEEVEGMAIQCGFAACEVAAVLPHIAGKLLNPI